MVCILLRSAPVRVHDIQAYRNMDVTRDRIGRIVELRKILLPFQTGFNRVNAAAVGAVLERIPGLEPHMKLVTVSSFCPFTMISVLMPQVFFVISLVFSALISMQ